MRATAPLNFGLGIGDACAHSLDVAGYLDGCISITDSQHISIISISAKCTAQFHLPPPSSASASYLLKDDAQD